ncbi:MAG: hypothetical protein IPH57_07215 [Saprospiraceae bacterium]|nr:hypothetical protein [Saprospiraceae bacterium]
MRYIIFIAIFLISFESFSQENLTNIQPTIMVVPFKKQDQKFITEIENNRNYRVAIAKIDEYFLSRNFRTIDFVSKYQLVVQDKMLAEGSPVSIEQNIAMNNNADIIVYFDIAYVRDKDDRYADLYLKAVDSYTAQVMSSAESKSETGNFDDLALYIKSALANCGDNFLNTLQEQFEDIKKNGRPIRLNIEISSKSVLTMDDISEKLEDVIYELSYKNYFNCPVLIPKRYSCDDVRIPLYKDGKRYNSKQFVREFKEKLSTVVSEMKSNIVGNNVHLTIK